MTDATTLGGTAVHQAIAAPTTSAAPARSPQSPASAQMGIDTPSDGRPAILPRPVDGAATRAVQRRGSGGKILARGLLTQHEEHRLPVLRSLVAIAALADPVGV